MDRYGIGAVHRGMMKIAEVTTDTEIGCLAVGTVEIAGPSIEIDMEGKDRTGLLTEPLDLFYISYRTGRWTPLWEYNASVTERDAEREKKRVIDKFRALNRAKLDDIDQKLKMFISNQFYKMAPEEISCFELRLNADQRWPGKLASERESPSTRNVLQQERSLKLLKAVKNDHHFRKMKRRAGCN